MVKEFPISSQETGLRDKKREQVVSAPDILGGETLQLFVEWRKKYFQKKVTFEEFYTAWRNYFLDEGDFSDYVGIPNPEILSYLRDFSLLDSFGHIEVTFQEEELEKARTENTLFDFNKIFFVEDNRKIRISTQILPLEKTEFWHVKDEWIDLSFSLLHTLSELNGGVLLVGKILFALEAWETVNLQSVKRDGSFYPTFPEDEERKYA